jgi:hypothetical protein
MHATALISRLCLVFLDPVEAITDPSALFASLKRQCEAFIRSVVDVDRKKPVTLLLRKLAALCAASDGVDTVILERPSHKKAKLVAADSDSHIQPHSKDEPMVLRHKRPATASTADATESDLHLLGADDKYASWSNTATARQHQARFRNQRGILFNYVAFCAAEDDSTGFPLVRTVDVAGLLREGVIHDCPRAHICLDASAALAHLNLAAGLAVDRIPRDEELCGVTGCIMSGEDYDDWTACGGCETGIDISRKVKEVIRKVRPNDHARWTRRECKYLVTTHRIVSLVIYRSYCR